MRVFLVGSLPVSRVLSRTIIYLAFRLLRRSSGYRPADGSSIMQISLQPTGFTSTPCRHGVLWALTSLVSPFPRRVVSFLWHFP